jgi:hypothetical protein
VSGWEVVWKRRTWDMKEKAVKYCQNVLDLDDITDEEFYQNLMIHHYREG